MLDPQNFEPHSSYSMPTKTLAFQKSYINFSTISYQKEYKIQRRDFRNIKKRKEFIFLGIFIFSLILFYIFQINLTVDRNYQVREFEDQISGLRNENQKLTVETLSLENSQLLAEQASYFGLEESKEVQYVRIFTPTLVQNR